MRCRRTGRSARKPLRIWHSLCPSANDAPWPLAAVHPPPATSGPGPARGDHRGDRPVVRLAGQLLVSSSPSWSSATTGTPAVPGPAPGRSCRRRGPSRTPRRSTATAGTTTSAARPIAPGPGEAGRPVPIRSDHPVQVAVVADHGQQQPAGGRAARRPAPPAGQRPPGSVRERRVRGDHRPGPGGGRPGQERQQRRPHRGHGVRRPACAPGGRPVAGPQLRLPATLIARLDGAGHLSMCEGRLGHSTLSPLG